MKGSWALLALIGLAGCEGRPTPGADSTTGVEGDVSPTPEADPNEAPRLRMVEETIEARGVRDPELLQAMRTVPRHRFVPDALRGQAYSDRPLPIGSNQTISQPYIVALMTELAGVEPGDRVLEIGTGSGYQAAVLAEIAAQIYSIEILPELSAQAATTLADLGYDNIELRVGDGYRGWPEEAPFDAIVVTAAPPSIPEPLLQQLAVGGRLVVPVGRAFQELILIERTPAGFEEHRSLPVRFVPMTGEAQQVP